MSKYETLDKLFYKDDSDRRYENNQTLYQNRLTSDSAFRTGIHLRNGELFFIVPRELSVLQEEVFRVERKISAQWKDLPGVAQFAYFRSLILDEIIETNEMEGVRSTRKQIMKAIDLAESGQLGERKEQFVEFANLYLELNNKNLSAPQTPEDIRKIYDAVVDDAINDKDLPDGRLFRASGVDIRSRGNKVIHQGVDPEEKIYEMLQGMIRLAESEDYPALYRAIISHFLFEYIHPFYDGNGRTGRYLLAKYLTLPLSLPTVLSLSKTIAESKDKYYKAFEVVEHELNHAEATFFVKEVVELIRAAQSTLLESLDDKKTQLLKANELLDNMKVVFELSEFECSTLYGAIQIHLFGTSKGIELDQIAELTKRSKQSARAYVKSLESKGLLIKCRYRPAAFDLTKEAKLFLGLADIQ